MAMNDRAKRVATRAYRAWEGSALNLQRHRIRSGIAARLVPAAFWYGRYPHTFVERRPPENLGGASLLPRRIWVCWTGPNEMSDARRRGLEQIERLNAGARVDLVTPANLADFIVEGHPLHPAYEHLSYTHRADYLRAYLMHHHGGAYSDIKPMATSWARHFGQVEETGAWMLGPVLRTPYETGANQGKLGAHMRRYYRGLMTGGALVARSHTALTAEWLREVDRRMTYAAPALMEFPHDESGDGAHAGYPLAWMELLGEVLQPLLLKHSKHVLVDPDAWWDPGAEYR